MASVKVAKHVLLKMTEQEAIALSTVLMRVEAFNKCKTCKRIDAIYHALRLQGVTGMPIAEEIRGSIRFTKEKNSE